MTKIKSYVVITFCYRKANILQRWSNILHFFYGNKGLCHCCRSYWFRWKLALLHCLWAVAILKSLLCLSAGPLQESYCFSIYQHTAFSIFLTYWQLASTGLCSDLVLTWTDTDWTCWLTVDTQVRKHKHRFETDSGSCLSTPVVHYLRTDCGLPFCVNNGRTAASSAAVSWRHHDNTIWGRCATY